MTTSSLPTTDRATYGAKVKAARLARRETLARAAKRHGFDETLFGLCEAGKDVWYRSWDRFVAATQSEVTTDA